MKNIEKILKVFRYIKIYGASRTLIKVLGRLRINFKVWKILKFPYYRSKGKKVGIVGCGQHAFSSIAYYLTTSTEAKILFALDNDIKASSSLAHAYNIRLFGDSNYLSENLKTIPDLVYISSNHASHTDYAVHYLEQGCDVFIEKPISINQEQLNQLKGSIEKSSSKLYTGYNRPHSPAIKIIKKNVSNSKSPFSLSCFVSGHYLDANHWYRKSSEGTRIVANLGHWIDLSVHMLCWKDVVPEYLDILISYSDINTPSDNIILNLVSSTNDLISITFTSRAEPFEGVNETINFQQGELIAKIDDFRVTKIWQGKKYKKYIHWPKNNGHKASIIQPFDEKLNRPWNEVELSTRIMLHVEEMVKIKKVESKFKL